MLCYVIISVPQMGGKMTSGFAGKIADYLYKISKHNLQISIFLGIKTQLSKNIDLDYKLSWENLYLFMVRFSLLLQIIQTFNYSN